MKYDANNRAPHEPASRRRVLRLTGITAAVVGIPCLVGLPTLLWPALSPWPLRIIGIILVLDAGISFAALWRSKKGRTRTYPSKKTTRPES